MHTNPPTPEQHAEAPHLPAHIPWEAFVAAIYRGGLTRLMVEVQSDARLYVEWTVDGLSGEPFSGDCYAWCFSEAGARIVLGLRDEIEAVLDNLEAEDPDLVPDALATMAFLDEFIHGPSTGEAPGIAARPLEGGA